MSTWYSDNMTREELHKELALMLKAIYRADLNKDYHGRYTLVLIAIGLAAQLGYPTGFDVDLRVDPPGFPIVAYIEIPEEETQELGVPWVWHQLSWHMPVHINPYDGHTTPEKYRLIQHYIERYGE